MKLNSLRRLGAIAVMAIGLVVVPAGSASAYDSCGYEIKATNGNSIAKLCFTYVGDGYDNVYLVSTHGHLGVSKKMYLKVCTYAGGGPYTCASDSGTYKYFAGPVARRACRTFTVKINSIVNPDTVVVNKTITETCN